MYIIEDKMLTEARQFWWDSKDHRAALNKFPRFSYIERNILKGLCDTDTNYMGALNKVATLLTVRVFVSTIKTSSVVVLHS